MYKLIFAIIAVLALQGSFYLYNVIERTDADFASIGTVSGQQLAVFSRPMSAAQVPESPLVFENTSSTRPGPRVLRTQDRITRRGSVPAPVLYAAATKSVRKSGRRAGPRTAAPIFPSTTIVVASSRPRLYDGPVVKNEPDRKSFVAKVVKKPYDWLKAVGSKLF
jgi:hypothetical protein